MLAIIRAILNGHLGKALTVFYLAFTVFLILTESTYLIAPLNAMLIALYIGVCVTYFPAAWEGIKRHHTLPKDIIIVAIAIMSIAFVYSRLLIILIQDFGMGWLRETNAISAYLGLMFIAGVMFLNAPAIKDDCIPLSQWRVLGKWLMVGFISGLCVIWLR